MNDSAENIVVRSINPIKLNWKLNAHRAFAQLFQMYNLNDMRVLKDIEKNLYPFVAEMESESQESQVNDESEDENRSAKSTNNKKKESECRTPVAKEKHAGKSACPYIFDMLKNLSK